MASETMTLERALHIASCHVEDVYDDAMNYAPQGKCITCERPWPCEMAVLAEAARATTAGTGAGGGSVTREMVEVACAEMFKWWKFSTTEDTDRDYYRGGMRDAITAALAASARGAAS